MQAFFAPHREPLHGQGVLRPHPAWENSKAPNWALTFLVMALIAALFGFGGVTSTAAGFAQICFFIFLVLFLVSTVAHVVRRR